MNMMIMENFNGQLPRSWNKNNNNKIPTNTQSSPKRNKVNNTRGLRIFILLHLQVIMNQKSWITHHDSH
jgi:hypothetical protein